jgi:hypothetical protein
MSEGQHQSSKSLPYHEPYAYFEHLPERTLARMQSTGQAVPWYRQPVFAAGMAIIPILLAVFLLWRPGLGERQPTLADLDSALLMEYLLTHSEPHQFISMADELGLVELPDWSAMLNPDQLQEWLEEEDLNETLYEL